MEDAFNMLCGDLIGEGLHRKVFECKIRPDLVVKVEEDTLRYFANVREMNFWCDHENNKKVAPWLAPCEFLSPDGRVLLQKRCSPARREDAPDMIPSFFDDTKISNFGILDGKFVCVDYAIHTTTTPTRLVSAVWL